MQLGKISCECKEYPNGTYLISWRKKECCDCLRWHSLCCIKSPWIPLIRSCWTCRLSFTASRRFLTSCCVARTSLPTKKKFSSLAEWTRCMVAIVSSCVFRIWSTSWDKLIMSSHKFKMETVVHAASFNGTPRINPAPAPRSAMTPKNRFERGTVLLMLFRKKRLHYFCELVLFNCCSFHLNSTRCFNCVIPEPYISLIFCISKTFWAYMPAILVFRIFASFNNFSAPVRLTSGIFRNSENTGNLFSLSEVTAWYLKRKAAPFLETGTSGWSFRWVE